MNFYNYLRPEKMELGFDDVLLVPRYSEIKSRKDIYLTDPDKQDDSLPMMSSPMDTVTGLKMAVQVILRQGVPILHRNMSREEAYKTLEKLDECRWSTQPMGLAVSSDISSAQLNFIHDLMHSFSSLIICLDTAHGHTATVKNWLEAVKPLVKDSGARLMAGSVCTTEAVTDLKNWGADIIRFGVGNGSICSTRLNTGHGYPQLSGISHAARYLDSRNLGNPGKKTLLVADGGIRNAGDAAKALAAGADYVMLGSMLAGTDEAPGEIVEHAGQKFKSYRGMASRTAQEDRQGQAWSVEGVESLVACKGSVVPLLEEFRANLKSAYSYSGANGLKDLQRKAKFVRVSPTTVHSETGTHIFNVASRT